MYHTIFSKDTSDIIITSFFFLFPEVSFNSCNFVLPRQGLGKLWSSSQIWPVACFWKAYGLYILNALKKIKKLLWHMKCHEILIFFMHKVLLKLLKYFLWLLSYYTAGLNYCNREYVVYKAWHIYNLAL